MSRAWCCLMALGLQAQEVPGEERLAALRKLMTTRVSIASRFEQADWQAPSVVSVVDRREIEAYGCRDLADVLRMIPGFDFGLDVQQLVGLSFRGVWGHEGKVLLMIDGIVANEFAYGNSNFFGTFPAGMIERVEVIRGPGSAVYGQFASVAVINLITHSDRDAAGGRVEALTSSYGAGEGRYGSTLVARSILPNGGKVSVNAGLLNGPLGRTPYVDFAGGVLPQGRGTTNRDWSHVLGEVEAGALNLSYLRTQTIWYARDGFTTLLPRINGLDPEKVLLAVEAIEGRLKLPLTATFTLSPHWEISNGTTATVALYPASQAVGQFTGTGAELSRRTLEMLGTWAPNAPTQLLLGVGWHLDRAKNVSRENEPGMWGDHGDFVEDRKAESRYALAQLSIQGEALGFTLGGRYEGTDFGSAFAPRAGLTWSSGGQHLKLLFGRAFRIPLPWQAYSRSLSYAGFLRPETSSTWEVEWGRRLGPATTVTLNAFDIRIDSPLSTSAT